MPRRHYGSVEELKEAVVQALEALGGVELKILGEGTYLAGFCVKMVGQPKATFWGCSRSCCMAPPLFSHPGGPDQVAHEGVSFSPFVTLLLER